MLPRIGESARGVSDEVYVLMSEGRVGEARRPIRSARCRETGLRIPEFRRDISPRMEDVGDTADPELCLLSRPLPDVGDIGEESRDS